MPFEAIKQQAAAIIADRLGENVRYHYKGGDTVLVRGIFALVDSQVVMNGTVSIDSYAPSINIRRDLLTRKPKQGDMVTRRDVTYTVRSINELVDASWTVLLHVADSRADRYPRAET